MREELFGQIVTAYVYPDNKWEDTLEFVNKTAPYGLTRRSVAARDRGALRQAHEALEHAARNFYVNDKPTAVVGQQPFGGGRASERTTRRERMWNLIRWASPRTIKETFVPATDYRYPFMAPDSNGKRARAVGGASGDVTRQASPASGPPVSQSTSARA